jgi:hypothetical protein
MEERLKGVVKCFTQNYSSSMSNSEMRQYLVSANPNNSALIGKLFDQHRKRRLDPEPVEAAFAKRARLDS